MAAPGQPVMGTVVSTGWGVRSEEAATVLGLPIVSNSLNWVKVAKRFPVYIHLEDPPEALMRVGASARSGDRRDFGRGGRWRRPLRRCPGAERTALKPMRRGRQEAKRTGTRLAPDRHGHRRASAL